ncbi:MAG TPA: hypothetical protein VKA67_11770, partial [Verrucomicrobiae bacterium]|nr:hypothetical protein [Verrucomicrobiae bacterium]
DTGLVVLVLVGKGNAPARSRHATIFPANFSVKEKDEASLPNGFRQVSLDAFILRFAGVKAFLLSRPRIHPALDFSGPDESAVGSEDE